MEAHGTKSLNSWRDHVETPGKSNGTQNTTNCFHSPADHGNDVRHGKGTYGTNKRIDTCKEHRSCPRRIRGRVRLGRRLQGAKEGRLRGRDCTESDHLFGGRRGGHFEGDRRAARPRDSRPSLVP